MSLFILFVLCSVSSALLICLTSHAARILYIADNPDDSHKLHDTSTPFVGGVGILAALCIALFFLTDAYPDLFHEFMILGVCSVIIFAVGFADDAVGLGYKLRFIAQAVVAFIMVLVGGMVLSDFGGLFFSLSLQPGLFAIPITVFAIIGSINALNMIDGIDGLSGSISLTTLLLISVVAFIADNQHNFILAIALVGGVLGFLYFNLRFHTRRCAQVFLGDNGSMLLGLIFAWLLVSLSQGASPAMTPVTAVWLFSIPLMDTVSVMLRRIWMRKSPFTPDRHHLHHLLQKAGFFVTEIVFVIVSLHALFGVIGLIGLYLSVHETVMFFSFLLVFTGYFYLILRPWKVVPLLRHLHVILNTRLAFAPTASPGIFFHNGTAKDTKSLAKKTSKALGNDINYGMRIFVQPSEYSDSGEHFSVTLNVWPSKEECISKASLEQYIVSLKQQLKTHQSVQLRHLAARSSDGSDLEIYKYGSAFGESKTYKQHKLARRKLGHQALVFEVSCCK